MHDKPTGFTTSHKLATTQWENYCKAMTKHGWELKIVDPAPLTCPDSVFVEDTCIIFQTDKVKNPNSKGNIAVIAGSMGAKQRRDEVPTMEATIKAYIFEAIEVEKAGLKIEYKKKEDYSIPEELTEKFLYKRQQFWVE